MKTMILYYSYGGTTKKLAEKMAEERNAELYEVKDKKRPPLIKAVFVGCACSIRQIPTAIEPIVMDMEQYDRIIIMAPIWNGNAAPPIYNVISMLPPGSLVEFYFVSKSGRSNQAAIITMIDEAHCTIVEYINLEAPKKEKKKKKT